MLIKIYSSGEKKEKKTNPIPPRKKKTKPNHKSKESSFSKYSHKI